MDAKDKEVLKEMTPEELDEVILELEGIALEAQARILAVKEEKAERQQKD